MHSIDITRIIRTGLLSFQRNTWLTTASVVMMSLVLLVVGGLVLVQAMTNAVLASFSDKIDVSVYMKPDTPETSILQVQKDLEGLSQVKSVAYVSQDEALARFRDANKENALILNSLDELDKNPLQASLNIKAQEAGQFQTIADYLTQKSYPFIDKINFFENKLVIERLGAIAFGVRAGGIVAAVLFAAIAVIIAFNTIRLAIYSKREEIRIMKLVGASHWYIRGPFVVEGVLHGILSSFAALVILYPAAWIAGPKISLLIPGFDLFAFFQEYVFGIFFLLLVVGIVLGVVSSMIAMRRYLKEVT